MAHQPTPRLKSLIKPLVSKGGTFGWCWVISNGCRSWKNLSPRCWQPPVAFGALRFCCQATTDLGRPSFVTGILDVGVEPSDSLEMDWHFLKFLIGKILWSNFHGRVFSLLCHVSSLGRNHFSQVGFVEDRIALKGIPLLKWRTDFNPTSPQAYLSLAPTASREILEKTQPNSNSGKGDFSGQLVVNPSQMALLKGLLQFRSELALMHGD